MKILVKEIDKYSSKIFSGKVISEYLIYLSLLDNQNILAFSEFGNEAKNKKIKTLIETYSTEGVNIDVEEITFEDLKNRK